jgi:signal transduction histidine kinase
MTALKQNIELATTGIHGEIAQKVERALGLASAGEAAKVVPVLEEVVDALKRTRPRLDRLNASYKQLWGYNGAFLRDISSYSVNGPVNLRAIVDASVKLVSDGLLTSMGPQIGIEYTHVQADSTTRVYCSPLLKQHLYSIFDNAVLALDDRLKEDPRVGTIQISITKDSLPPGQEVALNTSWAVSIKDNGNGVTPEDLVRLRKFEPGTSLWKTKSTGSGLVALQRFMNSIGGRVELKSTYGESFEVILHIYEDRPNI